MNFTFENIPKELRQEAANNYWKVINNWALNDYKPKDRGSQYAWDTLYTDKYLQCKAMINACKRHILYMYKSVHEEDFKFEYSSDAVNGIVEWFATHLSLTEGIFEGKPFLLEDNQVFQIAEMFGWSKKGQDSYILMTDRAYNCQVRKQGKSQLLSGIADLIALNPFGNDSRPQIFFSGPIKDVSDILREKAMNMASASPTLRIEFDKMNTRNFTTYGGASIEALPFEKNAIEGRNPSFSVATEYHLHPDDKVVESIESAKNKSRPNSLLCFDTTKGTGIGGVAYKREAEYKKFIYEQVHVNPFETINANIFTFITEFDDEDSYEDIMLPWEKNPLRKSNPMLGITIDLEDLQNEWLQVRHSPDKRKEFIIKKVGRWIGNLQGLFSIDDLINSNNKWKDTWKTIDDLRGEKAAVSIDLSSTTDTNAIELNFKAKKDFRDVRITHLHTFISRDTMEERMGKEKLPYDEWIKKGWVTATVGKTVDYKEVANYIIELAKNFKIEKILYDPFQMATVKYHLMHIGKIDESLFQEVPQNAKTISAPLENLVKDILDERFYFFGNEVLLTQFLNVVPIAGPNGTYFRKTNNSGRIDAFAAAVTGATYFTDMKEVGTKEGEIFRTWEF